MDTKRLESIDELSETVNGKSIRGIVIANSPTYEVWFPYSVETVKLLASGKLLGVQNTSSIHLNQLTDAAEDEHYSILRIQTVTTRHFQVDRLRLDRADSPESIEALLGERSQEWQRRLDQTEQTNLRIVVSAVESGLELHMPLGNAEIRGFDLKLQASSGVPLLGNPAFLFGPQVVEQVTNRDMAAPAADNSTVTAGHHTLFNSVDIPVNLDADALIRRHFGIFGFTGAGKSNLLSTLIEKVLGAGRAPNTVGGSNALLFDVNNEYFGLLIDVILKHDSHIVILPEEDGSFEIGASLEGFLAGDFTVLRDAAQEFLNTTTLSRSLQKFRYSEAGQRLLLEVTQLLLGAHVMKLYFETPEPLAVAFFLAKINDIAESIQKSIRGAGQAKKREAWSLVIKALGETTIDSAKVATASDFDRWQSTLVDALDFCTGGSRERNEESSIGSQLTEVFSSDTGDALRHDLVAPLQKLFDAVAELRTETMRSLPESGSYIDRSGLLKVLHDHDKTLIIFLGSEISLRRHADSFGQFIYQWRRKKGFVDPATAFIFDEADVFIPGQSSPVSDDDKESIKLSRRVATTLARRGRKYGLGIGLATQRIVYLDTSILAQLGTNFVGKLPRATDRRTISDGFGMDEGSLQQGVQVVGDWMVLSHTAVGDKGSPIPVHFPNADERLLVFLSEFSEERVKHLVDAAAHNDYLADLRRSKSEYASETSSTDFLPVED